MFRTIRSLGPRRTAIYAFTITALGAVTACGAIAGSSRCDASFAYTGLAAAGSNTNRLTYRADLTQECMDFVNNTSGNARILVRVSAVTNPAVVLESFTAGTRRKSFDTSQFTLKFGSIDTTIDSSLTPEWSLPWKDKPTSMSLTFLVPATLADSERPIASVSISQ